ncbi:MAG: hypothetical protein ACD_57C00082G0004 [uncultured bacterium]|nr:MAG: hypothetical protein ACD_57C00082G0004 [uncultured bacterium]
MEYKTKDLGEAGALVTKNVRLLRLENQGEFYWFVFANAGAEKIANDYLSGDLLVPAKLYNDSLRSLKDRLFAQR